MKNPLLRLCSLLLVTSASILLASLFTGCATTSTAPDPASSPASSATSTIEAALPLIRTGASVAAGAVLDFAVKQDSTRQRLAGQMAAAAAVIHPLANGVLPTPAELAAAIVAAGGSTADAKYAQFSIAVSGLYAAYYPKIIQGDTKTGADVLGAVAAGVQDATSSYLTASVVASTPN